MKLLVATQRSVIIIPKQVGRLVLGGNFLTVIFIPLKLSGSVNTYVQYQLISKQYIDEGCCGQMKA